MKSETMRIAMLGQKAVPSRAGGVEVAAEALATRMVAAGHQVICYNRSGSGEAQHKGVILKHVPTINRKGLAAVSSSFFAALYASLSDAQIIHIHAEGPAFMSWIPKLFGKTVVVTIHGLDWQRAKWKRSFGARYIRWGEKAAVRFADEIIVLSENLQQYFYDTYHRKTVLIPNSVEALNPEELQVPFHLTQDGYLLYLGRLVPEKGIHTLIEAFLGCRTDKKLVIAGEAADADTYAEALLQQSRCDSRVLFLGPVEGELLRTVYRNAYCFVLPSELEGMSLSLLEAMHYGNCCVVSDIPENREVVGDTALLFPTGNADALRQLLQRLCDSPEEVAQYKQAASRKAAEKPDWNSVTDRTLQLYRNAMEGRMHENSAGQ